MKKKLVIIIVFVIAVIVVVAGGYLWYEERNAPPGAVTYADKAELEGEIKRLEGAGKLSWQDGFRLGVFYMYANRLDDAIKTLEESGRMHPGFDKTHESLGMAYFRLDNFDKAVEVWQKAIELNPASEHLKDMIERAKRKGEFLKRVSALEEEIKKGKIPWQKRFELATLYIGLNKIEDAKRQLKEAAKIKGDSSDVFDALGQVYAIKGDFDNAIFYERKALKLKPNDDGIKKRLSEMERLRTAVKKGEFHKDKGVK